MQSRLAVATRTIRPGVSKRGEVGATVLRLEQWATSALKVPSCLATSVSGSAPQRGCVAVRGPIRVRQLSWRARIRAGRAVPKRSPLSRECDSVEASSRMPRAVCCVCRTTLRQVVRPVIETFRLSRRSSTSCQVVGSRLVGSGAVGARKQVDPSCSIVPRYPRGFGSQSESLRMPAL